MLLSKTNLLHYSAVHNLCSDLVQLEGKGHETSDDLFFLSFFKLLFFLNIYMMVLSGIVDFLLLLFCLSVSLSFGNVSQALFQLCLLF